MSRSKLLTLLLVLAVLLVPTVAFAGPDDITAVDKTIIPAQIAPGGQATVSLTMTGTACQQQTAVGVDVALVLDRSGTMYYQPERRIEPAVDAAKSFLTRMDFQRDQAALVSFSNDATIDAPLGSSLDVLNSKLDWLASLDLNGSTAIGSGIFQAFQALSGSAHKPANARAMIVLSDGQENQGSDPVGRAAQACSTGVQVFTIGVGSEVDSSMQQIPCNGGKYYFVQTPIDPDKLRGVYDEIANQVIPIATNATVTDQVPVGVSVVPGSISDGGTLSGMTITWQLAAVKAGQQLTYRVTATQLGVYVIGPGAVTSSGCDGSQKTMNFPDRTLTVTGPNEVPEPATLLLLGTGLAGLAGYVRRRRKAGDR